MVVVAVRAREGHRTSERLPIRCKTVLRRVCCGLQHTAGFCVTNARARHCAGYLLGGGAARALAPCARRAAMGVVGPCATKCQYTSGRSLLSAVRPWCDVPGAASTQPAFAWQTRGRHCIGYLLNLGAARALATRARCAAMVVVGLRSTEGHCTSERPLIRCKTVL